MARKKPEIGKWHASPLKGSFMVTSIVGLLVTAYMIKSLNIRISLLLVFGAMFVASIISMTKAPIPQ